MRNLVTVFVCVLLAGCASETKGSTAVALSDEEEQGRNLLGNLADALASGGWHFAVRAEATVPALGAVTVSVANEVLIATDGNGVEHSDPEELEGMVFADDSGVARLRIADSSTNPVRYELEYSANGIDWTPYCDPLIDRFAVPFAGRWSTHRYHVDEDAVTFGCARSGVTVKCVDWGYGLGSGGPTSSEWKRHQACTQMANANYCNNGIPHTRELTPIAIRDFIPGAQPDANAPPPLPMLTPTDATWPPADDFYFEAAWTEYGPAICLSRLRWASLPTGGYCPGELPDPRNGDDPRAVYCDDLTLAQLTARGARFINGSMPMDLFLHQWRNGNGDLVTTVAGFIDDTTRIAPFPGYTTYVGPDAILLRNLPGSLVSSDVIEVYEQENLTTGDRVTAPLDANGTGLTKDYKIYAREGYLFVTQRNGTVAFSLYQNGKDFVSAIAKPNGFSFVRKLGYVIAP